MIRQILIGAILVGGPAVPAGHPSRFLKSDHIRESQWHIAELQLPRAHTYTTGAGASLGLLDSSVFLHVDIRDNVTAQNGQSSGDGDAKEGNGEGHGTHLAGLMVGHGHGKNSGILGIAPSAHLLSIDVLNKKGAADKLAVGIKFAIAHGSEILNISISAPPSRAVKSAISEAEEHDALLVAAIGNYKQDAIPAYPATSDGVLAVGATDRSGKHAIFSVRSNRVSICAPGAEIVTTDVGNSYTEISGTSAAAAIVSGAAALVRSRFPGLSAPEVIHRLTYTATDIGPPGRDDECGFGVVNIVAALTAEVPPLKGSASGSADPGSASPRDDDAQGGDFSRSLLVTLLGGFGGIVAIGAVVVFLALRRRRVGE